ncbi:hypothetical protein ACHAXR_009332 [Thalassiosira sp. AJA248-18]
MRTVQVVVQLQRHENNAVESDVSQGRATVTISYALDYKTANNWSDSNSKYILCSILLQLGKILGVSPSHAPSPYISSIFDKILEKWYLRRGREKNEKNADRFRNFDQFSQINDGDELVLCCSGYVKDYTMSASNNEADLLALIPSKCNIVTVALTAASALARKENMIDFCDGSSDGDSDIEDVTDLHASKKSPIYPDGFDDIGDVKNEEDKSAPCFWEYDEDGNMRRNENNETENAQSSTDSHQDDDDFSGMGGDQEQDVISISSDSSSGVEDVTEIEFAKRNDTKQKLIADAEEIYDSEPDCAKGQMAAGKKRKRASRSQTATKQRKKKTIESPIEIIIDDNDLPTCPGAKSAHDNDSSVSDNTSGAIKQRIVKLLNTGFHGTANEHEARNAMKLARRLCEKHNLDQAVLLQERGDGSLNDFSTTNDSSLQGGIVTAKIRNRKKQTPPALLSRWHDFLVKPVCMNFHVEAFKTVARSTPRRAGECSVTFYGIRTNAQLAAYAFKIASERISLMAAIYEAPRKGQLSRAKQQAETRNARLSYALGIVNGLGKDVRKGLQEEEERRKDNLKKAQMAAKTGEAYHEDNSDGGYDGHSGDSDGRADSSKSAQDNVGNSQINHNKESSHTETQLDQLERENTAQLALVDHRKNIASGVLKSNKIKVCSARKHKSITLNPNAYKKGVIDSKEIDLNQQAIQE